MKAIEMLLRLKTHQKKVMYFSLLFRLVLNKSVKNDFFNEILNLSLSLLINCYFTIDLILFISKKDNVILNLLSII